MRKILPILLCLVFSGHASALNLSQLSEKDAVAGLKAALDKGSVNAVNKLGKVDGFLGNPRVRIPLPQSLQRADHTLKRFGMGKYTDDLEVRINRAAELAVPEAKTLLLNAIKQMSVKDAKNILTGGDTAATDYFRAKTSAPLAAKFLPIVQQATAKVQLAQKYDEVASKASRLGLLDKNQSNLEAYVTQKALDGLFLMMADEEKAIRADPVGQTSKIISKVFGSLLR
jgi:hypothetical protein